MLFVNVMKRANSTEGSIGKGMERKTANIVALLTNHTWPIASLWLLHHKKEPEELEKIQKSTSQMIKGLEKGFGGRLQHCGLFVLVLQKRRH